MCAYQSKNVPMTWVVKMTAELYMGWTLNFETGQVRREVDTIQ